MYCALEKYMDSSSEGISIQVCVRVCVCVFACVYVCVNTPVTRIMIVAMSEDRTLT